MTGSMKGDITGRTPVRPKRHLSIWLAILLWLALLYAGIWVHDLIWHR